MTREIWTDQELREATGKVREVLLGAVPPPLSMPTRILPTFPNRN